MDKKIRLKTLIIEDEEPARTLIKHYLKDNDNIDIAGECADGFSGLKAIKETDPDLLFLDIQMPKLTGFELLEVMEEKPCIIFTTAYDEYAIKAFEMNAVDYLLKPFSKERFDEAVEKAMIRVRDKKRKEKELTGLTDERPEGSPALSRVVVNKSGAISFIPVSNIIYLSAEDDYVMIWHKEGKHLKQKTMKYYEKNLPEGDFIRIHRSYIVAVNQISRIEPYGKDTHVAILGDNTRLPVSKSGYKTLKEKINF